MWLRNLNIYKIIFFNRHKKFSRPNTAAAAVVVDDN